MELHNFATKEVVKVIHLQILTNKKKTGSRTVICTSLVFELQTKLLVK